jgi:hypothetical protein
LTNRYFAEPNTSVSAPDDAISSVSRKVKIR